MNQPKISIEAFLGGHEIRFEMNQKPILSRCRYKINGKWIHAKINLTTGDIIDLDGNMLRRGVKA
jgi:hypothetical protein